MSATINIVCPVSEKRVDENVVRVAAVFTIIITAISIFTKSWIIALILAYDFGARAFTNGDFSIIRQLSKLTTGLLKTTPKPTDLAPKKFAAGTGFIFSLVIATFLIFNESVLAGITGGILIFCALLESVFSICLGCIVYSLLFQKTNKAEPGGKS
ncbi:MAG: DUF4395 domain-containing protein [Ignavibacteria bacterium]